MLKVLWLLALLSLMGSIVAQPLQKKPIVKNKFADSSQAPQIKEDIINDLPVITLNENERADNTISFIPALLTANRDIFMTAAAFHFNITRFRMRGYDGQYFSTQINGISMNNADDGNTQWGLWGGLNDVTRNTQMSIGLRSTDFAFGNIGNTVSIDTRAYKQWAKTQFGYSFANRSYTHRWMFTYNPGMNKKGWSFVLSSSLRKAAEGYVPGTSYSGTSYLLAVDKRLNEHNVLSLTLMGAATLNGKQSAVLAASKKLLGTPYYNAYWGYQAGKKRNANMGSAHQPVITLTLDHRISNQSSWLLAMGGIMGEKSSTALDWYEAPDPRPDYYRYLPGYQTDSFLQVNVAEEIRNNLSLQQINWQHLYDVNRMRTTTIHDANGVTGNSVTGLRSHYIVEARVTGIKRFTINSVFNTLWKSSTFFTAGVSFQWQQSHNFKKINDLLGGDYYVDWNQFAERDFPNDPLVIQNDLNRPNRILRKDDRFGYDYLVQTNLAKAWAQVMHTQKKFDLFAAAEISYTNYLRAGNVRNGLFLYHSFGKSELNEFDNYAVKGGITYKMNGRKYLYLHAAILSKAPLFDNVFISPRTRDTKQEMITSENIYSAEMGYVWNAPSIKLRLTGYVTHFTDGMNVTTFYHDTYRSFMNYALYGMDKLHYGTEFGSEIKLNTQFTINAAAAMGRYYYNNRQKVIVSADNDAYVTERGIIYAQNFRIAGTPQEAYSAGINYQSPGSVYLNISANYFRQQWLEFNPMRRTYKALQGVTQGSEQWNRIIGQTALPEKYTVDLSVGGSARLTFFGSKKKNTLLFNININNLLNDQDFISGGYEQLRFDTDSKNPDKFPPKFFYAMGLNFSANLTLRL